jgi:hypothetical protein
MTIATGYIVNKDWRTEVKGLVAIGVSLVLAMIQGLALGTFTFNAILKNLTIIFSSGEALYALYFKKYFGREDESK